MGDAPEKTDTLADGSYAGQSATNFSSPSTGAAPANSSQVGGRVFSMRALHPILSRRMPTCCNAWSCKNSACAPSHTRTRNDPSIRQKALVQQVVAKLTEVSFDQCIDKPQASLSSQQRACVHTVVGKYLDTSVSVARRAAHDNAF